MKLLNFVAVSLSVGFLAACGPGAGSNAPGSEGNASGASGASSAPKASSASKTAPAPRPVLEVPAGTHLAVIVDTPLSSKTSQSGDRLEGHLAQDLVVNDQVAARAGSQLRGRVTAAVPSGRVKTRARLAFVFDALVVEGGHEQAIDTQAVDITANDTHTRDAVTIGGGAGAGALVGALVDGGKGAGLGALIGAGAGTGVVLIDKGKNVNIAAGGTLSIELTEPLRIRR